MATQYMLSVHSVDGEPTPSPEEMERMFRDVDAFNEELRAAGNWVFAGGLRPVSSSTVVRVEDGEVLMTDGPFAEGKEHLGGFWVVSADDLDAAVALAARAARACGGPVEVRPFDAAG